MYFKYLPRVDFKGLEVLIYDSPTSRYIPANNKGKSCSMSEAKRKSARAKRK